MEPLYPLGVYSLGFFAAISIEADNVVLDLNGRTLNTSLLMNLKQVRHQPATLLGSWLMGPLDATIPYLHHEGALTLFHLWRCLLSPMQRFLNTIQFSSRVFEAHDGMNSLNVQVVTGRIDRQIDM